MRRMIVTGGLLVVLLATTVGLLLPARAAGPAAKWSYKCVGSPAESIPFKTRLTQLNVELNKLGAQGWTLVAGDATFWCLKRPAP